MTYQAVQNYWILGDNLIKRLACLINPQRSKRGASPDQGQKTVEALLQSPASQLKGAESPEQREVSGASTEGKSEASMLSPSFPCELESRTISGNEISDMG